MKMVCSGTDSTGIHGRTFYQRNGKPWLDLLLIMTFSPLWLPLFFLLVILIFLFDGTPVFYSEKRAGRNGTPFQILKFRTLRKPSPGLLFTDRHSPLFTRLGPILRISGLDELPQMFNVLRGEMSLIGPRPLPLSHPALRDLQGRNRLKVRPGVSGLAQVNGRNSLSWPEKIAFDVQYTQNFSLGQDLLILLLTLPALLRGGTWFQPSDR